MQSGSGQTPSGRIVVGVDDSPGTQTALRWASAAARTRDARLDLIAAFDLPTPYASVGWSYSSTHEELPDWEASTRESVDAAVRAVDPSVETTATATRGYPADVLVEASAGADLVVVGSRGRGALSSVLLGSVGNAVAARAACPAVIVRGEPAEDPSAPVVVGVDGTSVSDSVLGFAFDHASRTGAPLLAVMSWWPSIYGASAGLSDPWLMEYRQDTERRLAECLVGWRGKYPDVEVEQRVVVGEPVVELCAHAADARLLVVGAHSRPGGARTATLLGSVSQGILHQLDRPVCVVRG